MFEPMASDFISLRKEQLCIQISEAREVGEQGQLLWLRSQWVHRYGLDTLQETEKQEKVLTVVKDLPEVRISTEKNFEDVDSIAFEDSINNKEDEVVLLEAETLSTGDLLAINEAQSKESLEQTSEAIVNEVIERSSTQNKPVVLLSPPIPSINHFRRWLPSLDNELPKAS